MNISRRSFLQTAFATGAFATLAGCCTGSSCCKGKGACCKGKAGAAVQLYSIRDYLRGNAKAGVKGVGFAKGFQDLAAIGYKAVEFAGYTDADGKALDAATLKTMLDAAGLIACGTHVSRDNLAPEKIKATCEFNLGFGNNLIICPGGGNFPPGKKWGDVSGDNDDWWKFLTEFYAKAAVDAAQFGCKIGLHNHTWEFDVKMKSGQTFWDYFFGNTPDNVVMEQDVGWTTAAGYDPCEQYAKYPHRSVTLHAKENGCLTDGKGKRTWADSFEGILGQPGTFKDGRKVPGVDWDKLFPVTDADGVKWYVVECERNAGNLTAVTESFKFLQSKGRC